MSPVQSPSRPSSFQEVQEIVNSRSWLVAPIGRGNHGSAYIAMVNNDQVCLKAYHLFLDRNPAKVELDRLQRARNELPEIKEYLQEPRGWLSDGTLGPLLVTNLVVDYSGRPSRTLQETCKVSQDFYAELERVLSVFPKKGVLYNPVTANILVQRVSETESRPVLIDLTNYNSYRHYPGKACLHLFSAETVKGRVAVWIDKTLREVRQKVCASEGGGFNSLSLPPRESYRHV